MTRALCILSLLFLAPGAHAAVLNACRAGASIEMIRQLDSELEQLYREAAEATKALGSAQGELNRCKQNPHPRMKANAQTAVTTADAKIGSLAGKITAMLPKAAKAKEGTTQIEFQPCAAEIENKAKREEIMKEIIRVTPTYNQQKQTCFGSAPNPGPVPSP